MVKFITEFDFSYEVYNQMLADDLAVIDTETGIVYQCHWYPGSLPDDVKEFLAST